MKSEKLSASRTIIGLNGTWEIEPGAKDSPPRKYSHLIIVPSLVDSAEPGYDWKESSYHWYRKSVKVDESLGGKFAFLRIDQSMYGTSLFLNGTHVGESISCYTSQEYRIDRLLILGGENRLEVRVGQRSLLPPESAVGKDQERLSFIPGIWGDVNLVFTGSARIKLVQTLPRTEDSAVDVNIWVENLSDRRQSFLLECGVNEKRDGKTSSSKVISKIDAGPASVQKISTRVMLNEVRLWSPDSPFLYSLESRVVAHDGTVLDESSTTFGMREFTIEGNNFYLNGKKIFLRGSNIAFHRFLSDSDRRHLPWNEGWIRKVLVTIPKAHNFNFFRAHLGHMYNRWYDIADEGGMLIQDEWQFWGATGTKAQIANEFSDWLKDNWNHPSIVIWDPLNESSDAVVQNEIVPEMKELDPTRPWESHDFFEDHPYIYSLGPVLVDRKFGYTRSLDEIRTSAYPSQVNEFLWWWLDKNFKPSDLTKKIVTRWLGEDYTQEELIEHQSCLATELTELLRRLGAKCIQPFVYLSTNDGPTSHWFVDNISDLKPKPILSALKNAFEPVGVSIELWDRHFFPGEKRKVTVFLFNERPERVECILRSGIMAGTTWLSVTERELRLDESSTMTMELEFELPTNAGDYTVSAALTDKKRNVTGVSNKIAHVYEPVSDDLSSIRLGFIGNDTDTFEFLRSSGMSVTQMEHRLEEEIDVIVLSGDARSHVVYHSMIGAIGKWIQSGGRMILLEPERAGENGVRWALPGGGNLAVKPRKDEAEGGYDSYVIADDISHPVWKGLRKIDLRIFNGAFGGEAIPQSDIEVDGDISILARSGIGLKRVAMFEKYIGKGRLIVSSIEVHGRLIQSPGCYDNLYARRPDPVAKKIILNQILYSLSPPNDKL